MTRASVSIGTVDKGDKTVTQIPQLGHGRHAGALLDCLLVRWT
jgi:hypothetical protein